MKLIGVIISVFSLSILWHSASGSRNSSANTSLLSENDSIEINGRFVDSCSVPTSIQIAQYEVPGGSYTEVPINKKGQFTYRLSLKKDVKMLALRSGQTFFEFLVTPKEKFYQIEISCSKGGEKIISIKNSAENRAFVSFDTLNGALMDTLGKLSHGSMSGKDTFRIIKELFLNYQTKIKAIKKRNRGTFTADVLCPSDILPKKAFLSIESLQDNYLQREVFASQQFYSLALPSRIISNYLSLLDKRNASFSGFEKAMDISLKDSAAAKALQQIYYDIFFNRHREPIFVGYINWAKQHPNEMFDAIVKFKLQIDERTMPGRLFYDFQLNDTTGLQKKLSETVFSSKLTLLIFYSPHCPHCQLEIPQLVPLWEKFKGKGLNFYTVGFDAKKSEWIDFIQKKLKPDWVNVFDASEKLEPEYMYNASYTPTYILINQQGNIISRYGSLESILQDVPEIMGGIK